MVGAEKIRWKLDLGGNLVPNFALRLATGNPELKSKHAPRVNRGAPVPENGGFVPAHYRVGALLEACCPLPISPSNF